MSNQELQRIGEDAAAAHLEGLGMTVIARNWHIKMGEIDIVALHGETLVFAEVKTRRSGDFIDPFLAVNYPKQKKLRRLAEAYITFERPKFAGWRFDVISLIVNGSRIHLDHIVDAF